jgi:hypothetical protein
VLQLEFKSGVGCQTVEIEHRSAFGFMCVVLVAGRVFRVQGLRFGESLVVGFGGKLWVCELH